MERKRSFPVRSNSEILYLQMLLEVVRRSSISCHNYVYFPRRHLEPVVNCHVYYSDLVFVACVELMRSCFAL
jgi:hypothetical protein